MRAAGGTNHHDLGLFSVGPQAPRARGAPSACTTWPGRSRHRRSGDGARVLSEAGALGGASDHGVCKSLYGHDPDGNEFEIMWRVPREAWGEYEHRGAILPLDLGAEVPAGGATGRA